MKMLIIKCHRCWSSFSAYLGGELGEGERRVFREHLQECQDCRSAFNTFRLTVDLCRELPLLPVPSEVHQAIMERIQGGLKPPGRKVHLIITKRQVQRKEVTGMENRERRGLAALEPMRDLDSIRDEFDRVFERFFRGLPNRWVDSLWAPAVDLIDARDRLIVRAVIPGIDRNNLEVKVTGELLVISGRTEEDIEKEGRNYYVREVRTGAFRREVPLPVEVEAEKVSAAYRNGILTITLPKIKEAPAKEVKIKVE